MCVAGALLLGHSASGDPSAVATGAPTTDRVGFPKDYQTRFKVLGVIVTEETLKVNTVYGNELAASVTGREKLPYPEGSVILVQFSDALKDANGQAVRDANGALQTGVIGRIDVMKRGKGFGEAYGENRAGEWEFVGYRLDGSYTTPPEKSFQCAACHRKAQDGDFVYRMSSSRARM